MRTIKLRPGDTFADCELEPHRWMIADAKDGVVTLLRAEGEEGRSELALERKRIISARRLMGHRDVDSRVRKAV